MPFFNALMARAIPWVPRALVRKISRRYIAGDTLTEALQRVRALNAEGFDVTLDLLGESASSLEQAQATADACMRVLDAIHLHSAQATLSVKPTALGLLMDMRRCEQMLDSLLTAAAARGNSVCLDMEDVRCTQFELDLYARLRACHTNVDLAVQAYLKRTYADIGPLLCGHSRLRICKGIYNEDSAHLVDGADRQRGAINQHFLAHVERCFDAGVFVSVATHDETLLKEVIALARQRGVDPARFELQMLLGVCEPLRDQLRAQGFKLRIYVPFGNDWYGYSTRRLKENPRIAGHVVRALFNR